MLIARLVCGKSWYAQIFDTENPVLNYTKEEQDKAEAEICDALRPDEIYAQRICAAGSSDEVKVKVQEKYPAVKFVDWGSFEVAMHDYLIALYERERNEKIAAGWTPFDTGHSCCKCGRKIYWDRNPEFSHAGNAPWGQPVHTWAHCTGCKLVYGKVYEEGLTCLNSNEPMPARWFYIENQKSYAFDI